jgi:hypothetical protein
MANAEDDFYENKVEQFGHVMTIFKWGTIACLLTALFVMNIID